jgi:hypothetical protein
MSKVKGQIDDVKGVMVANIEKVSTRTIHIPRKEWKTVYQRVDFIRGISFR